MRVSTKQLVVSYKYVLTQPIVVGSGNNIISKWLTYVDSFFKEGGRGLFVSPIFLSKGKYCYAQFHVDIDDCDINKVSDSEWDSFLNFCFNKELYPVFTGKRGLHILSNFLVRVPLVLTRDFSKHVRSYVWNKIKLNPDYLAELVGGRVDVPLSTTRQPTPRLGWRQDVRNFIIPILQDSVLAKNLPLLKSLIADPDKKTVGEKLQKLIDVETYLKNYVIPKRIIA